MAHCCFEQECKLEAQYYCLCLSYITYCCEFHLEAHLKLPNRAHAFDSILTEPPEYTKGTILEFLAIEKLKKEKLKHIILISFNQNRSNIIEENLKNVESDLYEITDLIKKISQVSAKGWILNPLMPNNDTDPKRLETIIPIDSELYARVKLFCSLSHLRKKKSEILNRPSNDPETEQEFRRICALYKNQTFSSLINKAYQECISAYKKITSTYIFDGGSILYIYDTENEKEEMKVWKFGKEIKRTKIRASLPNCELFCTGTYKSEIIAFIMDKNYQVRELKILESESILTAIYFNKSIYCFDRIWINSNVIVLSQRFDLDENRWVELASTRFDGNVLGWDSIIFNDNILISNHGSSHLLSYSIDIDSFSEIPYKFAINIRKLLINAGKKLYIIECNEERYIYESEAENEYTWKKIGYSIIPFDAGDIYCSYNNEKIYISISDLELREYFTFDLAKKCWNEIAYYNSHVALKRQGDRLEAIECYGQNFKFDFDNASGYINKNDSLYRVGENFEKIENLSEYIRLSSNEAYEAYIADAYNKKGEALSDWNRKLEAIECYNETIKLWPDDTEGYFNKGSALYDLGRNLEAIECYNKIRKNNPDYSRAQYLKGNNLYKLGRYQEAIECFNEVIELSPNGKIIYFKKGEAFDCLGRYSGTINCSKEEFNLIPDYYCYFNKGEALFNLGRDLEAIENFNEAIRLEPDNADPYNSKAKVLRTLGRNAEAVKCEKIIVRLQEAGYYFSKGNFYSNLGIYREAIKFYDEQIKCTPNHADTYNSKGYALFKLGNNFEAIESYSMAIELKPDNSIYFTNRANAFFKLGRITEAWQDSNRAEDLM